MKSRPNYSNYLFFNAKHRAYRLLVKSCSPHEKNFGFIVGVANIKTMTHEVGIKIGTFSPSPSRYPLNNHIGYCGPFLKGVVCTYNSLIGL